MKEKKITKFFDEYRFLSNFWPCDVEFNGIIYPSVEHAYQAQKTTDIQTRINISKMKTAGEVKTYGKTLPVRCDWDDIKFQIMEDLVHQKFFNNYKLKGLLMATDDAKLVEGNTWGDVYWGVCNGVGENNLGKILMKVREELFNLD